MKRIFANTSLATRLAIGLVILIMITTLSAGVPAYLLTRSQLEAQAWQQVEASQRATESLYLAEQNRSSDLTQLLAERPTLRRLVQEGDLTALDQYLRVFQTQSEFDVIQICRADDVIMTSGDIKLPCPTEPVNGFESVDERAVLMASDNIPGDSMEEVLGIVLTGNWLDDAFLQQLSTTTGVHQSFLTPAGEQLISTLPSGTIMVGPARAGGGTTSRMLSEGGEPFFATAFELRW